MRLKKRARSGTETIISESSEIPVLEERVVAEAPPKGSQPDAVDVTFDSLPISQRTLMGLKEAKFSKMTEIQTASISHALAGRDILGAAATGSGKTLAFLVPLLEKLYRARWGFSDGLGALVVSPTRELALQIFEVMRIIGKKHKLSAGLVMGGKRDFEEEQSMVGGMNILIATPGRLLQHLEQTHGFDASQVQIVVLDEADRLLDMGFNEQINSILKYLPSERQTMLFSATQTRSVKDLARLSLNRNTVEYISVHDTDTEPSKILPSTDKHSLGSVPERIIQNYVLCELKDKLNVLFSFLKMHLKSKMVVFFSSCAQVRFVFELFCALQPGIPLLALHGKLKQLNRTQIYFDFLKKPSGVLFATDIASRGLDFPAVDWVLQVDAPEDATAYIHRSGRTARYKSKGRVLLFLLPSEEEGMVEALGREKIVINRLTINKNKLHQSGTVTRRAASVVAADVAKKFLAEKAFHSYIRSIQLMPNQRIFVGETLDLEGFALSLGLPKIPNLRHVESTNITGEEGREEARKKKNTNRSLERLKEQIKAERALKRAKREGISIQKEVEVKKSTHKKEENSSGEDDELLVVKRKFLPTDNMDIEESPKLSERPKKAKPVKQRINSEGISVASSAAQKVIFDEEGKVSQIINQNNRFMDIVPSGNKSKEQNLIELEEAANSHADKIKAKLRETADEDRERERQRLRAKRLKIKDKLNRKKNGNSEGGGVTLGSVENDNGSSTTADEYSSTYSSNSTDEDDDSTEDISSKALKLLRS